MRRQLPPAFAGHPNNVRSILALSHAPSASRLYTCTSTSSTSRGQSRNWLVWFFAMVADRSVLPNVPSLETSSPPPPRSMSAPPAEPFALSLSSEAPAPTVKPEPLVQGEERAQESDEAIGGVSEEQAGQEEFNVTAQADSNSGLGVEESSERTGVATAELGPTEASQSTSEDVQPTALSEFGQSDPPQAAESAAESAPGPSEDSSASDPYAAGVVVNSTLGEPHSSSVEEKGETE